MKWWNKKRVMSCVKIESDPTKKKFCFFKYNFEIHILPQYSVPVLLLSMLLLPAAAKRISHKFCESICVNYRLTPEIPEDAKVQHD